MKPKSFFGRIPVKLKLFLGFFLIIAIGSIASFYTYNALNETSELVYTTYDRALMSGQFAQAAKFDYSQFDSHIKTGLMAKTKKEFDFQIDEANYYLSTLIEDIGVVNERSLSERKDQLISEIRKSIAQAQKSLELIKKKKIDLLKSKFNIVKSRDLVINWETMNKDSGLLETLTSLTDDSAEQGYIFRLNSEEKNNENLVLIQRIAIGNLSLSILLSFILSVIVISPLRRLDQTVKKVDEGDYSIRSDLKSRDEFGSLSSSFNHMLDTIERKDKSMASLLEALPYGLFYFEENGSISKERSLATDWIFPRFSSFSNIADFFEAYENDPKSVMTLVLTAFEEFLPFESITNLFPQQLKTENDRLISLSYRESRNDEDKLNRIIIIAQDVTELEKAKAERELLTDKIQSIEAAIKNKRGFRGFVREANSLFESLHANNKILKNDFSEETSQAYKRDLHSLKGLCSVQKFDRLSQSINNLEESIGEDDKACTYDKLNMIIKEFHTQIKAVEEIIGTESDRATPVNKKKLSELKSKFAKKSQDLLQDIHDLESFPLSYIAEKYISYIQSLSLNNDNKEAEVVIKDSTDFPLSILEPLDSSLTHIIRNCYDHGIETRELREAKSKPRKGQILFSAEYNKDFLNLIISDDGAGISIAKIKEKVLEKNLLNKAELESKSDQEILEIIFSSGFSTKAQADVHSGRGIGMNVVKKEITDLGGEIKVSSVKNRGTQFEIKIPTGEKNL